LGDGATLLVALIVMTEYTARAINGLHYANAPEDISHSPD